MTVPRPSDPFPLANALVLALGAILLALWLPLPARAQVEDLVGERELEYSAAQNAHQAAQDARDAVQRRFDRALQEVDAARASGNEDRLERALAAAQSLARQFSDQDRRVQETADQVEGAREALLAVLDSYLDQLLARARQASDPAEREALGAIIRDVNNRFTEVQAAAPPETAVVAMPEITMDPRDGPVQLRAKAELLERRGDQWEAQVEEIDRKIEELRRWQRRDRNVKDFLAGIERFDDTRVPVVPPGSRTVPPPTTGEPPAPGSDTLAEAARPLTLEERIANLENLKARLEDFIAQVRVRAEVIRRRAGDENA